MANLYRINGKLPKFTSLGSYPIFYLSKRGLVLCADCANKPEEHDGDDPPTDSDINWEDADLNCEDCEKRIESAYAEPEPKKD